MTLHISAKLKDKSILCLEHWAQRCQILHFDA